jgi:hypothetical protein
MLDYADGDPLFFLNCCGVPPHYLFAQLVIDKKSFDRIEQVKVLVANKRRSKERLKLFKWPLRRSRIIKQSSRAWTMTENS